MFLRTIDIRDESLVTDIILGDYRTFAVFRKYGIEYCCGGRVPLQMACEMRGLDKGLVKLDLEESTRHIHFTNTMDFGKWDIDFLIDYVRNIHHVYLNKSLPEISDVLERFTESHKKKYSWLTELLESFGKLQKVLLPHLEEEELVIFPYIRQIAHAHESREPYAALLVRTLRKPIENMMTQEHEYLESYIRKCRALTNNYMPPADACVSHKVCFLKLRELDNDLTQHSYIENNFIFPKAIAMEKELLRGA
jgi:regulator of cell morphogenesis and NO signaling